jgi:hypothetical protein
MSQKNTAIFVILLCKIYDKFRLISEVLTSRITVHVNRSGADLLSNPDQVQHGQDPQQRPIDSFIFCR